MKCTRCAAEVPGQAQFCMRCGTPVAVGRPGGATAAAHPAAVTYTRPTSSKSKVPAIIAAIALLLIVGAIIAFKLRPNGNVTTAQAAALGTGALTDTGSKIHDTGPLASNGGEIKPGPADPTDVIDYLKHVREIERQRVALSKQQLGQVLTWSATIQASNLTREMQDNPEAGHKEDYNKFQASFSQWSTQWEELSRAFNAYPKPVPSACSLLRDKYLDVLGKTSASMTTVGAALGKGMNGDAGAAIEVLTGAQGKMSADIDRACDQADSEVATVCNKYKISKDFDIKADGGAANPFGVGR